MQFGLPFSRAGGVTISGTVLSYNEVNGIYKTTVNCTSGGTVIAQATADAAGKYSLLVPAGTSSCTLTASGPPTGYKYYFVDSPREITTQSNRSGEDFIAGWQVSGSVLADAVYGAKVGDVNMLCDADGSARDYQTKTIASGVDMGKFVLVMKSGTTCKLSASKTGYTYISYLYLTPTYPFTSLRENLGSITFIDANAIHSISGKIYEGASTGISGATVECIVSSQEVRRSMPDTDSTGNYIIKAVPHGTVCASMVAIKSGYTFTPRTNVAVNANLTGIDFQSTTPSPTYTLTIIATNGTVTKNPNKTSYTAGEVVTLTATANAGYSFSSWSGDLTGTANPATITINGNKTVNANFTAVTSAYSISGKVYEGTSTAIFGATVKCVASAKTYNATSGTTGTYTINSIPSGTICTTLVPEKSSYTFTARTNVAVNSDLTDQDFQGENPLPANPTGLSVR